MEYCQSHKHDIVVDLNNVMCNMSWTFGFLTLTNHIFYIFLENGGYWVVGVNLSGSVELQPIVRSPVTGCQFSSSSKRERMMTTVLMMRESPGKKDKGGQRERPLNRFRCTACFFTYSRGSWVITTTHSKHSFQTLSKLPPFLSFLLSSDREILGHNTRLRS